MKIGFIGLGIMGRRMAVNLQNYGYSLIVFNRTRAKAEPLLGPCGTFLGWRRSLSPRNPRRTCDGRFLGYLRLPHDDPSNVAEMIAPDLRKSRLR